MRPRTFSLLALVGLTVAGVSLYAQVTDEDFCMPAKQPQNWLTYSGTYSSQRYSTLDQIAPGNVKNLEMRWVFQADSIQKMEATPIVVDGVMYVTQAPNDVVALDAKMGGIFWTYRYDVSPDARLCCGQVNRGLAIHGNTLFMGTIDAHLVALDANSGSVSGISKSPIRSWVIRSQKRRSWSKTKLSWDRQAGSMVFADSSLPTMSRPES